MNVTSPRYALAVEALVMLLLLIYPTVMLIVKSGMNTVFLLMLFLAMSVALFRPAGMEKVHWHPEWAIYTLAMLAMTSAILISQSVHQSFSGHPHDATSRYFLAVPVFLLLQRMRLRIFSVLDFAFPVAAVIGLLMSENMQDGRYGIRTLDLIHFGDLELLLGILSLLSIESFTRAKLSNNTLKVLGFISGLMASFASGSRGGWLAIPIIIAIYFHIKTHRVSLRIAMSLLVVLALSIALLYSSNNTIQHRANALAHDVVTFNQGDRDTSTGLRWQLYSAAIEVFSHHPFVGVGPEGFALEMQPMLAAGKLTPLAAELGKGEVHNDFLSKAAGMGIFGILALLAIYLVPLKMFWHAANSNIPVAQRAGLLGVVFVVSFLVFGLTVEFLNLTLVTAFYSFTVAVLLAACYNIHHDRAPAQPISDKE